MTTQVTNKLWIGSNVDAVNPDDYDKMLMATGETPGLAGSDVFQITLSRNAFSLEDVALIVQAGNAIDGWLKRGKRVYVVSTRGTNEAWVIALVGLLVGGMLLQDAIQLVDEGQEIVAKEDPQVLRLLAQIESMTTWRSAL